MQQLCSPFLKKHTILLHGQQLALTSGTSAAPEQTAHF